LYLKLAVARMVDPFSDDYITSDIGIENGMIKKVGEVSDSAADQVVSLDRNSIVCPGLIDIHTHVYHLATSLGVNADDLSLRSGVETFVDAGSAGAGNFAGFKEYVIKKSKARIYAFLNIGFGGIPFFGIGNGSQIGEIPDLLAADEEKCVRCARENRDLVLGIKVRLSERANAALGTAPLEAAKRCARELGLPVMLHFGRPPPDLEDLVSLLDGGDILTHSFRGRPNTLLDPSREGVLDAVKKARKRGVVIDIGHGSGSFSFETARRAIEDGFAPDTISTDIHQLCLNSPVYDLPTTMSKLLNTGMMLQDVIKAVTCNPAKAMRKFPEHGVIKEGAHADLLVLRAEKREIDLYDSDGATMRTKEILRPLIRISSGVLHKFDYVPFGSDTFSSAR
jgi:dihydroorotase